MRIRLDTADGKTVCFAEIHPFTAVPGLVSMPAAVKEGPRLFTLWLTEHEGSPTIYRECFPLVVERETIEVTVGPMAYLKPSQKVKDMLARQIEGTP